jgi:hypothetical protein
MSGTDKSYVLSTGPFAFSRNAAPLESTFTMSTCRRLSSPSPAGGGGGWLPNKRLDYAGYWLGAMHMAGLSFDLLRAGSPRPLKSAVVRPDEPTINWKQQH